MVFGGKTFNNNNNNFIPNILDSSYAGQLVFLFLTMVAVGLLIAGVVYLIQVAQDCLNPQAPSGYYESFASPAATAGDYKQELTDRLSKIKELNQVLDDSVDTFNNNVQDTCEVYAQVEDIYVGNNSGPSTEDEYNLPKEELDRRLARRKQSAKKRFQEARGIYGASINTPVYECFENPDSIPELEDELRSELETLETKIQSVTRGTVGQKGDSLNALLKFNNKYIKKSLQEMGNEKTRLVEGFSTLSGAALLKRADAAIMNANGIYGNITSQHKMVTQQQELVKEMNKTGSRAASGNITSGDLQV